MKKARKGFTLVELLIVVAILATLTAAMTASISGSTAKAKAATIASNVNQFVRAAGMYCTDNENTDISSKTTDDVLGAYIGKWADLKEATSVKYEAADITSNTLTPEKKWCVKVTISDGDKANIIAELEKIPGFGKYGATGDNVKSFVATNDDGTFYVRLWNGTVTATAPTE